MFSRKRRSAAWSDGPGKPFAPHNQLPLSRLPICSGILSGSHFHWMPANTQLRTLGSGWLLIATIEPHHRDKVVLKVGIPLPIKILVKGGVGMKAPPPRATAGRRKGPCIPIRELQLVKGCQMRDGMSDHILQQYPLPRRNITRRLKDRSEEKQTLPCHSVLTFHLISTFFLHV